jgi:hypothetical protein
MSDQKSRPVPCRNRGRRSTETSRHQVSGLEHDVPAARDCKHAGDGGRERRQVGLMEALDGRAWSARARRTDAGAGAGCPARVRYTCQPGLSSHSAQGAGAHPSWERVHRILCARRALRMSTELQPGTPARKPGMSRERCSRGTGQDSRRGRQGRSAKPETRIATVNPIKDHDREHQHRNGPGKGVARAASRPGRAAAVQPETASECSETSV